MSAIVGNPLAERVMQFNMLELPGQPKMMHMGTSYLVGDLWRAHQALVPALEKAESFISGFEGDELQEGVSELLSSIRAALARARGES